MADEMAEQPDVLARLVERAAEVRATGAEVVPVDLAACAIVARGSSDHAALLGQYLLEVATGRPVALASPSVQTLYRAPVDYRGVLVVGVSQSGATSEIVEVVAVLRAAGARTIAITNDPSSPLAEAAGSVIDLGAGPELAVPATKTVTATLLAFVLLAEGVSGRSLVSSSDLADLPGHIAGVLADEASVARAAARLTDAGQLVAVARGYLLAAARETALKLRETSGILAEGWSAADLRHGSSPPSAPTSPSSACAPPVPPPTTPSAWSPNWPPGGPTCCASTTAPTPTFPCLPVCLNRWPTSAPSCAASTWPAWSRSGAASTRTNRWGSIRSPRAEGGLYGTQLHPGPRAKT